MNEIAHLFAHPTVEEGKLCYLLDINQKKAKGKGKAKFFNLKGFLLSEPEQFAAVLQKHPTTATLFETEEHAWGLKYKFRCDIATPSNESVCIVSVWEVRHGQTIARLVTAHPHKQNRS